MSRRAALLLVLALASPARGEPPEPPIIEAGEVTVSSTRTERGALQIPGNVTRIDRKAIEESGARTLPELLRVLLKYESRTSQSPGGTSSIRKALSSSMLMKSAGPIGYFSSPDTVVLDRSRWGRDRSENARKSSTPRPAVDGPPNSS